MNGANTELQVLNKIKDLLGNNNGCIGFETLTITTTSKQLASVPATASLAIFQVESTVTTDRIRYREDGVAPTSTVGKFKTHGDEVEVISAQSIAQLKLIKDSAATGTTQINVTYYK